MAYVTVDVDVDLTDIDDDELIDEIEERGYIVTASSKCKNKAHLPIDETDFLSWLRDKWNKLSLTDAIAIENQVKKMI